MPQTHKVLGQANPAATALTSLYTVPSSTQAIVSSIVICNQATASGTYRIAVRPAGASAAALHYVVWDSAIPASDSIALTLGITLAATDVISVYSSSSAMSFHCYGVEIS